MEIRSNTPNSSLQKTDITRPIRAGIEERTREAKAENEAEDLDAIKKRGHNARLKIKQEAFEHRAHEARKRVTERARRRGQNYRKKVKAPDSAQGPKGPDKAEFSGAARALTEPASGAHLERADRVADLKLRYSEGRLDTQELIARTAFRLLGGDRD